MKRASFFLGVFSLIVASAGVASAQAAKQTPTFTKDVAPILFKNCVLCHRPNEIAPMSLMSYNDARPWAKAIKEKVKSREMPPWGADPQYGRYKNDRSLSQKDIDTVVAWVDGGAVKGEDKDMPPVPQFVEGWTHGREPDHIVSMPIEFKLPAEGEIPNLSWYTEAGFTKDTFIKAVEVQPGTKGVVHHAGVFTLDKIPEGAKIVDGIIVDAEGKEVSGRELQRVNGLAEFQENTKLLSYVPGRGYEEYMGDAGQRIKGNSYIRFTQHYQATGKPEVDRSRLGLWLPKAGEQVNHQIYHGLQTANYIVEGKELQRADRGTDDGDENQRLPPIPAFVDNFSVVSIHPITEPATVYGLTPHLHLRGKSMKFTATFPDGHEQVLLNVPKYDFNWQLYYELAEPVNLPVGSKVVISTTFDNSLKNPYNPAPHLEVYWSEQSWDEMYNPQLRVTYENRDLRKLNTSSTQQQQQ